MPFRLDGLRDQHLTASGFMFGVATSMALHAGLFLGCGIAVLAVIRSYRLFDRFDWRSRVIRCTPGASEYWLIAAGSCAGCVLILIRVIFASLSFRGTGAWLLSIEIGVAFTLVWSSIARRRAAQREVAASALDVWFGPLPGMTSRAAAAILLVILPVGGFAVVERAAMLDWDYLLQNLSVLSLYLLMWAYMYGLLRVRRRNLSTRMLAACAVLLGTLAMFRGTVEAKLEPVLTRKSFVPEYVLDGYAAADPSYRALRRLFWVDPAGSVEFHRYLRQHSLIQHVPVEPIDVDFVAPIEKTSQPPNIFILVVDSLRRDYLSVYNPAVDFTPNIAQFAAESDAFQRAFTHYGGTGLSMPSIWTGGLVLHKEYVLPFARMNTLDKLLKANGYRSLISMDHITAQLLDVQESQGELDRGRNEMLYDFCGTLGELQSKLRMGTSGGPVFAHTRSLNLHISKLTNYERVFDSRFPGFQGPAAAAIARMDGCFGEFVDFLKRQDIYDNSIVMLLSDHGDSLGDARRWGHTYTIFPEVVRIPLIVHVPPSIRTRFESDPNAVSFSTDITPSLYALLGYSPASLGWMYGRSLFVPPGTDQSWRAKEPFLIASSYGPVYGLLQDNGRELYIADAMNGRDYLYDMTDPLRPARLGVPGEKRLANQTLIRAKVGALADAYHFTP